MATKAKTLKAKSSAKTVKSSGKSAPKANVSKSGVPSGNWRVLRDVCFSKRLDGNMAWNITGMGPKGKALASLLASAPKAVAGPDKTKLEIVGQLGRMVWIVSLKGDVYSRNCPESGRVTGTLSAFKAGGVSPRVIGEKAVDAKTLTNVDEAQCVRFYALAPAAKANK